MADIKDQLIKDSYNYVLQSDLSTGVVYRIGGAIPVNPIFSSGLTINDSFVYSGAGEQNGYALLTDGTGYAYWGPVSGASGLTYYVQSTVPPGTGYTNGDRWFDTTTGDETVWINDGVGSGQWVQPNNGGGGGGSPYSGSGISNFLTIWNSTYGLTASTIQYNGLQYLIPSLSSTTITGSSIYSTNYQGKVVTYLSQGAGILLDNNTGSIQITNSDPGSGQNIFKDVYINDVYQFSASNNSDDLRFSGIGVTITSGTNNTLIFSAGTSSQTVSGGYLPLSGGTVTGGTIFQSGLTANTVSATTYFNLPVSGLTSGTGIGITNNNNNFTISYTGSTGITGDYLPLSGGTVYGNTFYTSGLTANTLTVTGLTNTSGITSTGGIIFPQKTISSTYTATTSDYTIDVSGGTFTVYLPSAVGIQGRLLNIKNNGGGAVTVQPYGSQNIDDKSFIILGETNAIQIASNGSNWLTLGYNITTVNSSTGVFEFTGMSKVSSTQFSVAPVRAWIIDDTTNPLSPQLYYVYYSGGTHTDQYVNSSNETFVYLTSGGTIGQSSTPLTEQQRRQNIFLGKMGHPDRTTINLVFSQPDFVLSPLAQLRDMFVPINLINGGVYPSANGANLNFNTSAGYLYGLGINFAVSTLSPNAIYVPGQSPTTFQYRTQTGGTITNVTAIDPTKWDVGGTITNITGTKATNQRIYLLQNGTIRVQYGQTEYNQLSAAIAGLQTETFVTFPNFTNNAILIGVLSVLSTATNLSDTTKAQFFLTSKFGETIGAAGGIGTTTLQQAYNNSSDPEITINSTLDGLSIKNGTGNPDNTTQLLQGENTAGTVTSFIRADGLFSGSSISTPGFIANSGGLTATTVSATTYYNLPLSGLTSGSNIGLSNNNGNYTVSFTGGSVSSSTNFTNGLTASTISATTYSNLPPLYQLTGGTYSTGTIDFNNTTGGTSFSVTGLSKYFVTGSTPTGYTLINGDRWFDTNSGIELVWVTDVDGSQWIQPTQGGTFIGNYLPISGGTVTGNTVFQSGLTANTLTTFNSGFTHNNSIGVDRYSGEVVKFGGGSTNASKLYYYNSSGNWVETDSNSTSTSTGMLGIGISNNYTTSSTPTTSGILVRGFARLYYGGWTTGDKLYVAAGTTGIITNTAPTTSGYVVRVIGYVVDGATNLIYFCPDNTWVQLV